MNENTPALVKSSVQLKEEIDTFRDTILEKPYNVTPQLNTPGSVVLHAAAPFAAAPTVRTLVAPPEPNPEESDRTATNFLVGANGNGVENDP